MKIKISDKIWISLITLSGLVMRLYGISQRPLDGDEGVILGAVSGGLPRMWSQLKLDVHPPFHYFLTWLSIHGMGVSEFSLRIIPALAGAATVYVVYRIGREFISPKVGLIAAAITAFSPYLIYYSQENRMYSVFILLFVISMWQWLKFVYTGDKKSMIWWFIALELMIWTQHLGLVMAVVQIIIAALMQRKQLRNLIVFLGAIVVFYLPLVSLTKLQFVGRISEQVHIPLSAKIVGIVNAVYRFGAGRQLLALDPSPHYYIELAKTHPLAFVGFILSAVVPLGLMATGKINLLKNNRKFWQLISSLTVVLVLVALASGEIGPRAVRYLSCLSIISYIYIAVAIDSFKSRWKVVAGLLLVVVLGLGLKAHHFRDLKSAGSRDVAKYILTNGHDGEKIYIRGAFLNGESEILKYYLGSKENNFKIIDYYGDYSPGKLLTLRQQNINEAIASIAADGKKIWYYDFSYVGGFDPNQFRVVQHNLGPDKEGKELILYEIN